VSLLSAAGLSKSFPGVRALEGVDFELRPGEVHALLGENGAGKSTLIKILGGAVVPDAGEARLEGHKLPFGDPLAVRRAGINVVYQELTLVPELTAAENIFLGREQGRPFLRRRDMARAAQSLLAGLGARVAPGVPVRALSVAQQQLVEIARALANESKAIILDEPSATLSDPEVAQCVDPSPPVEDHQQLRYWVVAVDRDPAGAEREGAPSMWTSRAPSAATAAPNRATVPASCASTIASVAGCASPAPATAIVAPSQRTR